MGDFMRFLREYGIIGLAIAVIIGGKAGGLVLPSGDWQKWTLGPFAIGSVLGALLNFIIVAWLVYMFSKKVLKEEAVAKK
jgi:large conductance mechanosensitive channel